MSTEEQVVMDQEEPAEEVKETPPPLTTMPRESMPSAGFQLAQSADTHPLVQAAIQSGSLDTTNLRELMALQRDWESGEAKKEYTRAMVDMKRELPSVLLRDKVVDFASKGGRPTSPPTSLAAAVAPAIARSRC